MLRRGRYDVAWLRGVAGCLLVALLLCVVSGPATGVGLSARTNSADDDDLDSLLHLIDQALVKVKGKQLRSDKDSPWVIMHGVIAFGKAIDVYDAARREKVGAIEFLLNRATVGGRRIFKDRAGGPDLTAGQHGVPVQGHTDQYLMSLAEAGVSLNYRLTADTGRTFKVGDLLERSRRHFRPGDELAYTLVALSAYIPLSEEWRTDEGENYQIEKLVELAVYRDPRIETCNGTHHLYGVAYALAKHRAQGGGSEEVWRKAQAYVRNYVEQAQSFQQEDGAFSGAGFRGSFPPASPREMMDTSGHTLEWLTVALSPEELRQPWVRKSVRLLCEEILRRPLTDFNDGGLYHAAHALRRYKEILGSFGH